MAEDEEIEEPYLDEEAYQVDEMEDEDALATFDGEFEPQSDLGASSDDEVYEAHSAMDAQRKSYKDSRRKLKEIQRNRGYFKGNIQGEFSERAQAFAREKARSRCSACGKIGHWAGDSSCSKSHENGPKRVDKKKKKKGSGKGGKGKHKAKAYG